MEIKSPAVARHDSSTSEARVTDDAPLLDVEYELPSGELLVNDVAIGRRLAIAPYR